MAIVAAAAAVGFVGISYAISIDLSFSRLERKCTFCSLPFAGFIACQRILTLYFDCVVQHKTAYEEAEGEKKIK